MVSVLLVESESKTNKTAESLLDNVYLESCKHVLR